MIFTKSLIYIHTPKTAGMSLQSFLVEHLTDEKIYIVTESKESDLNRIKKYGRNVEHIYGGRHLNIDESLAIYKTKFSTDPKIILTIIREPVEIIYSYYHHLLKPSVLKFRGMTEDNMWGDPKSAREMNFNDFASMPKCFYGMSDDKLMGYYESSEDLNIEIVPLPHLNRYLSNLQYLKKEKTEMEKRNSSMKTNQAISNKTKEIVYDNYARFTKKYLEVETKYRQSMS
jgi:hypothetical protein